MFAASSQLICVLSLQLLVCSVCQPVASSDFGKASGKQCPTISDYLRQEQAAAASLCARCRRSKRPGLASVLESVVALERLEVRSCESDGLQLFVERVLEWQQRCGRLLEASEELKELHGLLKRRLRVLGNGGDVEAGSSEGRIRQSA